MPQSYRGRFLSEMRNNERAMQALFRQLAASIASEVNRRADGDGTVPRSATFEIQQAAGDKVSAFFLGYNRQGKRAPFDILPGGEVLPVSPFMRQLWAALRAVVRIPVEQNAAILSRRLPADVLLVIRQAKVDPLAAGRDAVAEQIFRPNPLAAYDAPHQWIDPNGYRLSDRVWNTAAQTRQQIDRYLDTAIREGRGALVMSRELEQFLIPGRALRTKAPYGTDASFDAMRLARTEITRAHGKAAETAAAMNPFVSGMKWNLSASHPRIDICDAYARGGENGDGVYPMGGTPPYPAHPNCLCYLTNALIGNPDEILDELRKDIRRERALLVDKVGPVEVDRFTALLLGQQPAGVVQPQPIIVPPRRGDIVAPTPEEFERARLAGEQLRREREERQRREAEERRLREEREAAAREALRIRQEQEEAARRLREEQQRAENEQNRSRYNLKPAAQARAELPQVDAEYTRRIAEAEQAYTGYDAPMRKLQTERDRAWKRVRGATGDAARLAYEETEKRITALQLERRQSEKALDRLRQERRNALRAVVEVEDPATNYLQLRNLKDQPLLSHWETGMQSFNKLVSKTVWDNAAIEAESIVGRAYAKPDANSIHLQKNELTQTIIHEVGHILEVQGGLLQQALDFYDRRTAGEPLQSMNTLMNTNVYGDHEKARRGGFIQPYMGKDYGRGSTEIISMGIEMMYMDAPRFAREDADYFDFIYNLLRGR